ncbi:hypothetical protein [Roseobacter litoralis]|uniref:hypothetical protein n=1 Tax=Roseobacter litoralis TaxID=42443 RepID=UPI0024922FB6|nr:hypothetical protein [Roseobacter litoralis]
MASQPELWNSLEIVKLAVDLALPLALALVGLVLFKIEKRFEKKLDHLSFALEWKKDLYNDVLTNLNLLFQAFNYVGDWREFDPEKIISIKREIDFILSSYSPLFSEGTISKYDDLVSVAFETGRGRGQHLLIRANREMYAESSTNWNDSYAKFFVEPKKRATRDEFTESHDAVLISIFADMGFESAANLN